MPHEPSTQPTPASDSRHWAACERLAQAAAGLAGGDWLGRLIDRPTSDELRDYAPGDDFGSIDWSVCARHDELRCRVVRGTEDRFVYLLIDCARRLAARREHRLAARDWSQLLAGVALARGDCRLGAVATSGDVPRRFAPARGRQHYAAMRSFFASLQPSDRPAGSGADELSAAVGQFIRSNPRPGLVVVVSDFAASSQPLDGLERLIAAGFEPFVARIAAADALRSADCLGPIELVDAASDTRRRLTLRRADLAAYRAAAVRHERRLARYCACRGIGRVEIDPKLSAVAGLERLLKPAIWNFTSRCRL